MINELDLVVLNHDVAAHGLRRGDVGAVVHAYHDGRAFEVEFLTADGATVAVLTFERAEIRPVDGQEILHVRELTPASA